jgi:hypothetical protein
LCLQRRIGERIGVACFVFVMDRDARFVPGPAGAANFGNIECGRYMPVKLPVKPVVAVHRYIIAGGYHRLSGIIIERSFY